LEYHQTFQTNQTSKPSPLHRACEDAIFASLNKAD
jgi:hypothetical protein